MYKIKAVLLVIFLIAISYIFAVKIFPRNEVKAWTVTDEPVFVGQIRGLTPGPYSMNRPLDIALDSSGNIYVSDTYNQTIKKYNSSYVYIKSIGSYGTGDGQFNSPRMAVSGNYLYVVEYGGNRVDKFTLDGAFVTKWGSAGTGDGQFASPSHIAVNDSYVYVMDTGNNRVQKFDLDGNFVTKWGSYGTGDLQFREGLGIALDASGNVYTCDGTNRRIQKFDSNGGFIAKWGSSGSGDGQFSYPVSLAVDKVNSYVYAVDTNYDRVQKFSLTGTFTTKWGSFGSDTGKFATLWGVGVDASGNVYTTEDFTGRVQKFDSSGAYISSFGERVEDPGQFHTPMGVFADSNRNVYVAGSYTNMLNYPSIQIFSPTGSLLDYWGTYGTGNGQFGMTISTMREGNDGLLYLGDTDNSRIQVHQKDGTYVRTIGGYGTIDGKLRSPYGFDLDADDNVFVADFNNQRVQVFDKNGTFLRKWGSSGSGNGQFSYPYALAVDKENEWVYVADGFNSRIQKFDFQGNFLTKWSIAPEYAQNLSIDSEGYVYVFKNTAGHFSKYDSDGNEVMTFGHKGVEDGAVQQPFSFYWSKTEMLLYVADTYSNRIQIFSYDRTPATFDITTGGDGKVYVGDYILEQGVTDDMSGVTDVQYKVDGSGWVACTPKDGSWGGKNEEFRCELSRNLGDGVYTVQFKSTDSFSNTGTVTGVTMAIDTKADDLRITKVGTLTNTLNSDHLTYYYSQTSLTITGTAEPYSVVTFKIGGHTYTATAGANGSFSRSFNDNQLDLGTNDVTYYYTDMAGNKSEEKIITLVLGEQYYPTWLTDSGKKEDLINDDEDAQPNEPTDNTNNNNDQGNNNENDSNNTNDRNKDKDAGFGIDIDRTPTIGYCILPLALLLLLAVIYYYFRRQREARKETKNK